MNKAAAESFAESGVSIRRGVLPKIEPTRAGLGTGPQNRRANGGQHLSPLVHVGLDRERARPVRLEGLRPDGGTGRPEPH